MSIVTARFHGKSFSLVDVGGKQCDLIRQGSVYEPAMLEWVWDQKLKGTAVDAGANIGNMSLWFSEICGMQVVAFEPIETKVLVQNVALNAAQDRITVFPYGLGAEAGWAHPAGKMTIEASESGTIRVVTLDSHLRVNRKIALIKVDVEGLEVEVIQGSLQTIERWKPVVLTEEWEMSTTKEIGKLLKPLGYTRERGFGGRGRAPVGCWTAR